MPQYSNQGRVTRPGSTNFTNRLWLDLGHRLSVFAFMSNLESRVRTLANIWWPMITIFAKKISLVMFSSCFRTKLETFFYIRNFMGSGLKILLTKFIKLRLLPTDKFSRGEICVANFLPLLRMVQVLVVFNCKYYFKGYCCIL